MTLRAKEMSICTLNNLFFSTELDWGKGSVLLIMPFALGSSIARALVLILVSLKFLIFCSS